MQIEKILLVDDNDTDLFLHRAVIRRFDSNVEVVTAHDGQEALDTIAGMDTKPDLILLDINMPGMGGFEFLEVYDVSEEGGGVVAMLSSSDLNDDRDKAEAYGCVVSYVYKPLRVAALETLKLL